MEVGTGVVGDFGLADHGGQRAGFHVEEVVEVGDFVGAVGLHADFIAREAEITDGQVSFREGLVDERLEVALVLLAIREAAADKGDVIPFI